jgi:hypothetical protein
MEQHLAPLRRSPFASPLRFTEAALHRYPPGPLGLSPHRDSARSINLVAIFVLKGRGRFIVCQDRTGRGAVDLPNAPGDLLLLRAWIPEQRGQALSCRARYCRGTVDLRAPATPGMTVSGDRGWTRNAAPVQLI